MKCIKIAIILLFAAAFSAFPQSSDPAAIIDRTLRQYDEWGGVEAQFSINIFSEKSSVNESFEGALIMVGDKFRLTTPDVIVWFDGVTQWTYMVRTNEVNVSAPTKKELRELNPMLLLNDYKKDFDVKLTGESTTANARMAYDIALTPKRSEDIKRIEVQIEKSNNLPARLVVILKNDTRNTVNIGKLGSFTSGSDSCFVFPEALYPDIEIIDLR